MNCIAKCLRGWDLSKAELQYPLPFRPCWLGNSFQQWRSAVNQMFCGEITIKGVHWLKNSYITTRSLNERSVCKHKATSRNKVVIGVHVPYFVIDMKWFQRCLLTFCISFTSRGWVFCESQGIILLVYWSFVC